MQQCYALDILLCFMGVYQNDSIHDIVEYHILKALKNNFVNVIGVFAKKILFCGVHLNWHFNFTGYMQIQSSEATAGLYIPMVSPPFAASQNYCLHFHYKVWVSESTEVLERSPELEVYLSQSSHAFSGRKVWGSNGTGEGLVQIPVWARPDTLYRISFVAVTYDPLALITVANVRIGQGESFSRNCDQPVCIDEVYDSNTECECLCKKETVRMKIFISSTCI